MSKLLNNQTKIKAKGDDIDRDEPCTSWNTAETRKAVKAAAPCIGSKSQSHTHRTKKRQEIYL